jgi:hypothetical protein
MLREGSRTLSTWNSCVCHLCIKMNNSLMESVIFAMTLLHSSASQNDRVDFTYSVIIATNYNNFQTFHPLHKACRTEGQAGLKKVRFQLVLDFEFHRWNKNHADMISYLTMKNHQKMIFFFDHLCH